MKNHADKNIIPLSAAMTDELSAIKIKKNHRLVHWIKKYA